MILANLISNELSAPTAFAMETSPDSDAPAGLRAPDPISCRLQIDRVVREIESPEVRGIVDTVFKDMLRLLECLGLIEGHLRQIDAAEETFALFQLIHDEACVLIEFIREDGLNCAAMSEELIDTLDGITFAVNHDLQRVFEAGRRGATAEKTAHVVVGKLYRAHDVLTNCLQQSTITLAMTFDPELAGATLFNNSDMRYRQSLQLCDDLSMLLQLIETSEKNSDQTAHATLALGLDKFRNDSLECLMYSDWPQFESFCERIKVAGSSALDLEPVLHQFRCYLETLLSQVRMRAVLANMFPIRFGMDETDSSPLGGVDSSMHFESSPDLQNAEPTWDMLAIAV
jgi:hypothetical protein